MVTRPSVVDAVDTLLAELELDSLGEARAAIARALSEKLDDATESTSGAVAVAAPAIARALVEVLDVLTEDTGATSAFVAGLFEIPNQ